MAESVKYDNEQELKEILDGVIKFLDSETRRICIKFQYNDPNYINMVMTDLTFCVVMNLLQVIYKAKEDVKIRIYDEMAKKGIPIETEPAPRTPMTAM